MPGGTPVKCRQHAMKRIFLFPFLTLALGTGAVALLLLSNYYTFHRLADEEPIAELRFRRVGDLAYEAVLRHGDFCTPQTYLLYGDQWRLDAEFLKWRPWANLLGFDAMYRVERLGGRYADIDRENNGRQLAYELVSAMQSDLTGIISSYHGFFTPVDTLYGSSVYADMDEGTVFRVFRSQSGLFVRRHSDVTGNSAGEAMTIEINAACADEPDLGERVGRFLGGLFASSERP